jgi:hypothetical protein
VLGEKLGQAHPDFIGNYIDECRDIKLKLNDDRKIVIRTSALQDVQMILLFVRSKIVKG